MFLTNNDTGVVVYVGDVYEEYNSFGLSAYKTLTESYATFCHTLYEIDLDVVPYKNTYIDGVVGINPEWVEDKEIVNEASQLDRIEKQVNKIAEGNVDKEYLVYYETVNAAILGGET